MADKPFPFRAGGSNQQNSRRDGGCGWLIIEGISTLVNIRVEGS
jgi:hypothetical protein